MKKIIFFLMTVLLILTKLTAQSVSINNDGSTPHPSAILDVQSNAKGMLIPRMTSAERNAIAAPAEGLLVFDNETTSFWFYKAAGWTELVTGGGTTTNFWNTDGTHIFNNNTGNVGIGTNIPTSKLTIQTPLNTNGFTHIGGANEIIYGEGIGGVSAAIGTTTNHAFRLNAGGTGRISIYPAGDVVVGSNATGSFGKFSVETPENSYGINQITSTGIRIGTFVGGSSAGVGTYSNTNMRIFCNNLSAMFISATNGNVGIGTSNPTYKLSVLGNIRAQEVVVETGWADYVFNENYKLTPLNVVEKFIEQNKHLPNMPSAKEVEEEGLHIGDIQKRMMEKIEELTLYVIEANKRIEKLEKIIEGEK